MSDPRTPDLDPIDAERGDPEDDRSYKPLWLVFAPFLGKTPPLTRRQWNIMGLIGFVTIFDQYDLALFSLALKQIQADLQIPEAALGELGALVRLGALPAFFLMVVADRLGRRRVLLFTIVLYTCLTGLTAFAPDATTFIALQFLARTFAVTEVLLAYVVISEELDPEHRGWGIGALGALAACGHGLAFIAFANIDVLPGGWRALYLLGLGPLVLLAWMRRQLPETGRFEARRAAESRPPFDLAGAIRPVLNLIRMYPGRFAAIASVIFLLNYSENAVGFFAPKYFQEVHGWTPGQFAMMGFFGGFLGIFGSAFAGRLSDKRGRRPVAFVFLLVHPLAAIAYYQISGVMLPVLWILSVFSGIGGGVVLGAFGNEMFPTSYRSTSSGARMVLGTIGGVLGLWTESALYVLVGSHWMAISLLASLALLAPLIVYFTFPETRGRSLEDISPER
ncbi:MAG: MFS transporter [Proteobacteria bacterium]|nr:MFS transporter [Pseudomonadota bacterium]